MQLGLIGLGRMGANMGKRLLRNGHSVVGWNREPEPIREIAAEGGVAATSTADLVKKLQTPRHIWLMLPAGVVDHIALPADEARPTRALDYYFPWIFARLIMLLARRRKKDWNEVLRLKDHATMDYVS